MISFWFAHSDSRFLTPLKNWFWILPLTEVDLSITFIKFSCHFNTFILVQAFMEKTGPQALAPAPEKYIFPQTSGVRMTLRNLHLVFIDTFGDCYSFIPIWQWPWINFGPVVQEWRAKDRYFKNSKHSSFIVGCKGEDLLLHSNFREVILFLTESLKTPSCHFPKSRLGMFLFHWLL